MNKPILTALLSALLLTVPHAQARSVHDIEGKQIDIPQNVNRLANLWPANNQVTLLLGGADKLVATTQINRDRPWFVKIYPRIKQVPALSKDGLAVQTEALAAMHPDVVMVSIPDMQKQVERAGMKAVLVKFQNFDGMRKTIKITADVIGGKAPSIAQTYLHDLDSNLNLVASRTKALPDNQKPLVMHIANGNKPLQIDGGKSIAGEWIRTAGGKSAFPDLSNMAEVGMESVIKTNPDVIIIGGRNAAAGIATIKKNPAWQSIKAVKNNRIYANPTGVFAWDRYSAEEALEVLWAGKLLHPQLFKDVDMTTRTQTFYKKYYRYNLNQKDAQRILQGLDPQ